MYISITSVGLCPVGVVTLFRGKSAFQHNFMARGRLGMICLHILTDGMAERIAQGCIYQKGMRSIER